LKVTNVPYIIGVHGLDNKPAKGPHEADWKLAIVEGLKRNQELALAVDDLPFELVYWADWRKSLEEGWRPIDPAVDPEPYEADPSEGKFQTYGENWHDVLIVEGRELAARPLDWFKQTFGIDAVADTFLERRLPDLGLYYADREKCSILRGRLRDVLLAHKGKRIMLVAHSMGTIVTYDVLRDLEREPSLIIDHLVTLGSPLGLPHVLYKILNEHQTARTPENVRRWSNLADRHDPVAADTHLANEFKPNAGGVAVEDDLVLNTYKSPRADKPNHHKI
jgi:hypothetical protein